MPVGDFSPKAGSARAISRAATLAAPTGRHETARQFRPANGGAQLNTIGPDATVARPQHLQRGVVYCGTKSECVVILGSFLLLLIIWGVYEALDWLF